MKFIQGMSIEELKVALLLARESRDQLQAENKKLKSKKHISLTQAREMALFTAERIRERQKWANAQAENKRLREFIDETDNAELYRQWITCNEKTNDSTTDD